VNVKKKSGLLSKKGLIKSIREEETREDFVDLEIWVYFSEKKRTRRTRMIGKASKRAEELGDTGGVTTREERGHKKPGNSRVSRTII